MKKINNSKASKGTVTVRKKGNSYEARVTLDLNAVILGVNKNPRLSRCAKTEMESRKRLGELITDIYFKMQNKSQNEKIFSDECTQELDKFQEYKEEKARRKALENSGDYALFTNMAKEWLNWKKEQINQTNNKTISPKTVESYVNIMQKHIMQDFKNIHISQISKELVENYINEKRKTIPVLSKDLYLIINNILIYCRDERKIIKEVPNFNLKFPKKKRTTKAKIPYLTEERQKFWLDCCENDGRGFALLFATLLQTGMRPEERLWAKMEKCVF